MAVAYSYPHIFPQIGSTIANDIFSEAVDYFLGNVANDELDSEEEDSEDDDDDAEEIDLEKPRAKKAKNEWCCDHNILIYPILG